MIAKLRGIIDTLGDDCCIIDVNGVGYLVFASAKTLGRYKTGDEAELFTVMTVREDDISLYGFADAWEKEWYQTLTKVQGVGSKVCLSILSVLTPQQISQAVNAQDKAAFCRASGVGPKLAARIVSELKGKIVTPAAGAVQSLSAAAETPAAADGSSKTEDVISALVNLGYQRGEAYIAATSAAAENPDAGLAALIRLALKKFADKEF